MLNVHEIAELKETGVILVDNLCDDALKGIEPSTDLSAGRHSNNMDYTGFLRTAPRIRKALHVTVNGKHVLENGKELNGRQLLDQVKLLLGGLVISHEQSHVEQKSLFD